MNIEESKRKHLFWTKASILGYLVFMSFSGVISWIQGSVSSLLHMLIHGGTLILFSFLMLVLISFYDDRRVCTTHPVLSWIVLQLIRVSISIVMINIFLHQEYQTKETMIFHLIIIVFDILFLVFPFVTEEINRSSSQRIQVHPLPAPTLQTIHVIKTQECCICFELITEENGVESICHHQFHKPCIQKWTDGKERPTCPLCRSVM